MADGTPLAVVEAGEPVGGVTDTVEEVDLDRIRPDLAELFARRHAVADAGRPDVVARRHELRSPDGPREHRRPVRRGLASPSTAASPSPPSAAGAISTSSSSARRPTGWWAAPPGSTATRFDDERARCAVVSYDYTVLAGTQGQQNHRKKDRLFELVERLRLPVVLFAEGGGGRPGDTDYAVITGLDTQAFALFGPPERPGAAGRHRVGPVLRRERRAARLLRRHHRHRRAPRSGWAARP